MTSKKEALPKLFDYKDYRKYLGDWYVAAKEVIRGFSFRSFSMKAGFSSPNFLKRVIDGERNLTADSLKKCSLALGHNKQETEFFKLLVLSNQASSPEEKNKYFTLMMRSRKMGELKPMEKNQYEYYSHWYYPVLRELITNRNFDGTHQWLADHIEPPITVAQVEKALKVMEDLGFISVNAQGCYQQDKPLVTTGPEVYSATLMNYHSGLLVLMKDQLTRIPGDKRDVTALTLGIKKARLPLIKQKIQEFRQEILKMVADDVEAEEVVLLAMQLMPVSK